MDKNRPSTSYSNPNTQNVQEHNAMNIKENSVINKGGTLTFINKVENMNVPQISSHSVELSYRYQLPPPSAYFCGREEELQSIEKYLEENTATVVSQTAISGLGGVGKSEIVKAYATSKKDKYEIILFIKSDSPNSLWNEFQHIAGELKIPTITEISQKEQLPRSIRNVADNIYKYCSSRSNALVVFDNVDEQEHIINYLPRHSDFKNKVHVLITSRVQGSQGYWDLGNFGKIKVIPIDVFTSGSAYEFVKKVLDNNIYPDDQIIRLCELLQFLPLALSQATSYIKSENKDLEDSKLVYTIEKYIQDYECKKTELLGYQDVFSDCNSSVITTWKITIDKLKSKGEVGNKAIELLEQMSYFAPDDIPVNLFSIDQNPINGKAVTLLIRYSFVKSVVDVLTMHRLLQEVTKINLTQNSNRSIVLKSIIELLDVVRNATNITPLFYVCKKGMKDIVEYIIENEFDPTERSTEGSTAIFHASNLKIIKILVNSGKFDIRAKDDYERTILMYACRKNDLEIVKYLLSSDNFDINDADQYKMTAFLHACSSGSKEIIAYILDNYKTKLNMYVKDIDGTTAFMLASYSGDVEKVQLLLNNGYKCNTDEKNYKGSGVLSFACRSGDVDNIKFLLENFTLDINEKNCFGTNSLMFACRGSRVDAIPFILENSNNKLNDRDDFNMTPFMHACWAGSLTVVKYLVEEYGSELNFNDKNCDETTALMFACWSGDLSKVKYLIEMNVFNVNETDLYGSSLIAYAYLEGELNIIQYLSERLNFDVNETDCLGRSLAMFLRNDNLDLFVSLNSQLNARDNYDRTTFMHLCWRGSVKGIGYLVGTFDLSNVLNDRDLNGRTALMYAAMSNDFIKFKYLVCLDEFAIYERDWNEWNLLMYACIRGNFIIVKYISENFGFDINERNNIGMSLLMFACQGFYPITIDYLINNSDNKLDDSDIYNRTPFMHACWGGTVGIVEHLYKNYQNKLNLSEKDSFGRSAFTYACWSGDLKKIEYLLNIHNFNVNDKDSNGTTILMFLCKGCRLDNRKFLSAYITFDENLENYEESFSALPCRGGNLPAVRFLLENYRVNLYEKDNFGKSALRYACTKGHQDVVDYLLEIYGFK